MLLDIKKEKLYIRNLKFGYFDESVTYEFINKHLDLLKSYKLIEDSLKIYKRKQQVK